MSLTVSIEPGPCGFAEGSRGVTAARTQPRPREGRGAARGSRSSEQKGAEGEGCVRPPRPRLPAAPRPSASGPAFPAQAHRAPAQRLGLHRAEGALAPPAREGAAGP